MERIRDLYHGFLGFVTSYFFFTITNANTFTDEGKAFGVFPVSLLMGVAINFVFNWFQTYLYKNKQPMHEYYLGALGGLYGGSLAVYFPNLWFAYGLFILALGYATFDLLKDKK